MASWLPSRFTGLWLPSHCHSPSRLIRTVRSQNLRHFMALIGSIPGKSIVARSFITDNCLERHNSSSRVIKIKSVFGEESIPLNTNQSMISQMIVQLQNDRANACLVYHIPRRGEIYLQKAISCSQPSFDSPSFDSVICISGILKHCYQQKGDGTCLCAADHPIYEGKFCAHETLECNEMNPCHNGGTCIKHEENGTYSCKCKSSKFSGEKCQKKDNPCANKQCSHGRCIVIFPDLPYCQCDSGYTGELCATAVNPCEKVYCAFNGTCKEKGNSFVCECKPGYGGDTCEKKQQAGGDFTLPVITGSVGSAMILFLCLGAAFVLTRRRKRHLRLRRASGMESTIGTSVYGKPLWQSLMESTKMSTKASTVKAMKSGSSGSTGKGSPVQLKSPGSPAAKQKPGKSQKK
ncbi:hypothetical protein M513_06328 [Trichuris suis]|uniref:EGF-like domain-containing protein n=1 Tax=Trichuris suis TaxID=68888 RepID=A0A085M6J1_9BILA|nr:hypothetical protein M513_06328 [Trichuris suis]